MEKDEILKELQEALNQQIALSRLLDRCIRKPVKSKRREVVDAQQDIIKGFIKLAKLSEGYRQHDAFEAISTLFNQTYDCFMEIFHKKNPI